MSEVTIRGYGSQTDVGVAGGVKHEAENQIYESMLHWNDHEVYEPTEDHAPQRGTQGAQDVDKHEATAPPWDGEADAIVPLQGLADTQYTTPIQCGITPHIPHRLMSQHWRW